MRSMQWQLGMLGTISAFAYRRRETKKNLCRGGRSQDLPNTDFQSAVRHLKLKKKQCPHSATYTHKITTTIHTVNQLQLHTRQLKTSNKPHETNQNTTCTKGKNTQVRQYCVQFLVIVFLIIISQSYIKRLYSIINIFWFFLKEIVSASPVMSVGSLHE